MPLFVCEKCGSIENTACGHYWAREHVHFLDTPEELKNKPLCGACIPPFYSDGSKAGNGRWHGRFEREHWSARYSTKPEGLLH